jgi:hypothetical protein
MCSIVANSIQWFDVWVLWLTSPLPSFSHDIVFHAGTPVTGEHIRSLLSACPAAVFLCRPYMANGLLPDWLRPTFKALGDIAERFHAKHILAGSPIVHDVVERSVQAGWSSDRCSPASQSYSPDACRRLTWLVRTSSHAYCTVITHGIWYFCGSKMSS